MSGNLRKQRTYRSLIARLDVGLARSRRTRRPLLRWLVHWLRVLSTSTRTRDSGDGASAALYLCPESATLHTDSRTGLRRKVIGSREVARRAPFEEPARA